MPARSPAEPVYAFAIAALATLAVPSARGLVCRAFSKPTLPDARKLIHALRRRVDRRPSAPAPQALVLAHPVRSRADRGGRRGWVGGQRSRAGGQRAAAGG